MGSPRLLSRIVDPPFPFHAAVLVAVVVVGLDSSFAPAESRVPWTESRIVGSPEPPLPFVLERAFPRLEFDKPVSIHRIPRVSGAKTDRLLVCEQGGRIVSFPAIGDPAEADLVADFTVDPPPRSDRQPEDAPRIEVYSLAFHPAFESNRLVIVCYLVSRPGKRRTDGTHIASFELSDTDPPRLLLETEQTILTFDSGGHNGCTVAFGPDGLLYISTGDAASPSPPDPYDHGQNVGDLHSAILRIDIDQREPGRGYSVPDDNPFVELAGARPEVYAFGFRNPWRMSFDSRTGDLWVGDVGWEAWEMVYRVRPGGNYGWPIKEGPGDTRPDAAIGPTPILPADIALPHSEAASVTGGVVYRGRRLPEIEGQYIFGDWVTRRFWAVEFDHQSVLNYREIAVGNVKPICFELDHDEELLILDYNSAGKSGVYRLQPNPAPVREEVFPQWLSHTGLLNPSGLTDQSGLASDTDRLDPAPGVVPYRIQTPMFRDGATAEYWLAIPGTGQASFFQQPQRTFDWFRTGVMFPPESVLVKTYWLERVAGDPGSRRPVETQIAHNLALSDWNYYTYRWNDDGRDAKLVGAGGEISRIEIEDEAAPGGRVKLEWSFAARSQCRTCHTPWRGESLGFVEPQLRRAPSRHAHDRSNSDGGRVDSLAAVADSWSQLLDGGYVVTDTPRATMEASAANGASVATLSSVVTLVDPHDAAWPLDARARSYLHANCSHCHLNGGNASVTMDVSFGKPLSNTGLVDTTPMRGGFELDDAKLVVPGAPERSVLLYRMAKLGSGRMPPLGTNHVDHRGVDLISRWIAELNSDASLETNDASSQPNLAVPSEPDLNRLLSGNTTPGDVAAVAAELLSSTSGSLLLASAMAGGRLDPRYHPLVIEQALAAPPAIAELFEPWADPSDRVERLGPGFRPEQVLTVSGDPEQGWKSFLAGRGDCIQCHQIHRQGLAVGPDLSRIGSKYQQPSELLAHLIDPSKEIAEPYRAVTLLTENGQVFVGRIVHQTDDRVTLQDASGREQTLEREVIEHQQPSAKSLMPEQLLDGLSAQQAADLLAFLMELK